MSFCLIVIEQNLINLGKLAEQEKNQRAIKIKSKLLKRTQVRKLAEDSTPVTEKLEETFKTTDSTDQKTQTPALSSSQNLKATQTLPDTPSFTRRFKNCFTLLKKPNAEVFWNVNRNKPLVRKNVETKNCDYDKNSDIQKTFTNTKAITISMDKKDKTTVFKKLTDDSFCNRRPKRKRNKSARMVDVTNDLPKATKKVYIPIYHYQPLKTKKNLLICKVKE